MIKVVLIFKKYVYYISNTCFWKIKLMINGYEDFFHIPFNYLKPLPKGAEKVLEKCCCALEKNGFKYYIAEGTALGFYREHGFIPHDDDLDVNIVADDDFDEEKLIKLFKNELGMKIGRKLMYKKKMQQLVCYDENEVLFDMMIWRRKDNIYYCFLPECKTPCKLSEKYFHEPYFFEFYDKCYPLHNPIEEWLVDRYGYDWKIPKTEKGDWRDDGNFN